MPDEHGTRCDFCKRLRKPRADWLWKLVSGRWRGWCSADCSEKWHRAFG